MDRQGLNRPFHSLIDYWLLVDSGVDRIIVFHCILNSEPTRLHWRVVNIRHIKDTGQMQWFTKQSRTKKVQTEALEKTGLIEVRWRKERMWVTNNHIMNV